MERAGLINPEPAVKKLQQKSPEGILPYMQEETARELIRVLGKLSEILAQNPPTPMKSGNAAVEILLSLVPLLGVILGVTIIFFFLLWRYKVTRELIRTEQYHPTSQKDYRLFALLIGCISAALGLPMSVLFYILDGASYVMLGGLLPFSFGIGLLVFFVFTRNKSGTN